MMRWLRCAQALALILPAACHPSSAAPEAATTPSDPSAGPAPVATVAPGDEESASSSVPEPLRSCLPELRWRRGAIGSWGVSEPLPGPEALDTWLASQRCLGDSRWTSVMIDEALGLADRVGDVFSRRCGPPRLQSSERTPPDEDLRVDEGVRRFLAELGDTASGRADEGQRYADRGRRQRGPLAVDTSEMVGGVPRRISAVRLLVLPMTAGELLGCWSAVESGERDPARDAVLGRWHGRWRAVPYAMTPGTLWLHVPVPPRRLGAIATVAVELAQVSPTLRLDGTEQYFVRAASHYWPVDPS